MDETTEEVVALDWEKGPLIVRPMKLAPRVCLALRRGTQLVYATYERTTDRDAEGRAIYREA